MSLPAPLRIRDLSKTVPGGRVLFEGLDLDLSAGEVVAITGESGAGKSSLTLALFRIIGTLARVGFGRI